MSSLGDAFAALRNVLLMQSDLERIEEQMGKLAEDMRGLRDYSVTIDKRVVRLETMVEMTAARASRTQPRIED